MLTDGYEDSSSIGNQVADVLDDGNIFFVESQLKFIKSLHSVDISTIEIVPVQKIIWI